MAMAMGRPHLLVIPYPAQGHVMPLMELSHKLVDLGFKITFVNTEATHKRVMTALVDHDSYYEDFIHLVSIPDGLEAWEDRHQFAKLNNMMEKVMPAHLEKLINEMNKSNNGDDKITCVIADEGMSWVFYVAAKMSIPKAAFWPASTVTLATRLYIPKLIQDGGINAEGNPMKNEIQLSPTMPTMNPADFYWLHMGDTSIQKQFFDRALSHNQAIKLADYLICNSFYELEQPAFDLVPNLRPIGPLIGSSQSGHFWPEDSTCLNWLDQQPPHSVIYVAFGSITVFDKKQFHELALGLEMSGKPFLWVVRPDLTNEIVDQDVYPEGFIARVTSRGRIVSWAPQREVLAHPSVGCFLTHSGWNSTMEGITHGVPLLCWPYFADQLLNKHYICHVWKIGLEMKGDENGLISREEIQTKVVGLLRDEVITENVLRWKEIANNNIKAGGSSSKNFEDFVKAIK